MINEVFSKEWWKNILEYGEETVNEIKLIPNRISVSQKETWDGEITYLFELGGVYLSGDVDLSKANGDVIFFIENPKEEEDVIKALKSKSIPFEPSEYEDQVYKVPQIYFDLSKAKIINYDDLNEIKLISKKLEAYIEQISNDDPVPIVWLDIPVLRNIYSHIAAAYKLNGEYEVIVAAEGGSGFKIKKYLDQNKIPHRTNDNNVFFIPLVGFNISDPKNLLKSNLDEIKLIPKKINATIIEYDCEWYVLDFYIGQHKHEAFMSSYSDKIEITDISDEEEFFFREKNIPIEDPNEDGSLAYIPKVYFNISDPKNLLQQDLNEIKLLPKKLNAYWDKEDEDFVNFNIDGVDFYGIIPSEENNVLGVGDKDKTLYALDVNNNETYIDNLKKSLKELNITYREIHQEYRTLMAIPLAYFNIIGEKPVFGSSNGINETFSKEWWAEQLGLNEIKILGSKIDANEDEVGFITVTDIRAPYKILGIPGENYITFTPGKNTKKRTEFIDFLQKNRIPFNEKEKSFGTPIDVPLVYFNIQSRQLDEIKLIKSKLKATKNIVTEEIGEIKIGNKKYPADVDYYGNNIFINAISIDIINISGELKDLGIPFKVINPLIITIPLQYVGFVDNLNESQQLSMIDTKQIIKDFVKFCIKELDIKNVPKIILTKDKSKTQTFAHYNPNDNSIVVYIKDRHILDIERSLSHELCHAKQNELNMLKDNSGETGSDMENMSNSVAGIFMREWGQQHPELYEVKEDNRNL